MQPITLDPKDPSNSAICGRGITRRLNDDECDRLGVPKPCEEFQSYCNPEIKHYIPFRDTKLNEWLDQLPEK